jgi:hypothetical protein
MPEAMAPQAGAASVLWYWFAAGGSSAVLTNFGLVSTHILVARPLEHATKQAGNARTLAARLVQQSPQPCRQYPA